MLSHYGVKGHPVKDFTGVWTGVKKDRKLCAIGVHLSRWVSMHGLALNVNPNLGHFNNIIPCGIPIDTKSVSSISNEIGRTLSMDEVKSHFIRIFLHYYPMDSIVDKATSQIHS